MVDLPLPSPWVARDGSIILTIGCAISACSPRRNLVDDACVPSSDRIDKALAILNFHGLILSLLGSLLRGS
jgi:hypothetical protein